MRTGKAAKIEQLAVDEDGYVTFDMSEAGTWFLTETELPASGGNGNGGEGGGEDQGGGRWRNQQSFDRRGSASSGDGCRCIERRGGSGYPQKRTRLMYR